MMFNETFDVLILSLLTEINLAFSPSFVYISTGGLALAMIPTVS